MDTKEKEQFERDIAYLAYQKAKEKYENITKEQATPEVVSEILQAFMNTTAFDDIVETKFRKFKYDNLNL